MDFMERHLKASSFFLKSQDWKVPMDWEVEGQVNLLPWPAGGEGREKWESGSGLVFKMFYSVIFVIRGNRLQAWLPTQSGTRE